MSAVMNRGWIKYAVVLIIVAGIVAGGYYLYSYINNQSLALYKLEVEFKPGVTEQQAINVLSKYGDQSLPRHYDLEAYAIWQTPSVTTLTNGSTTTIQMFEFTVKGQNKFEQIASELTAEPLVFLVPHADVPDYRYDPSKDGSVVAPPAE
jgi:hypothetical protein